MRGKNILIASCVFPPEPVVSATISFDLANKLVEHNQVTVISPKPTRPLGYVFENLNFDKEIKFKHVVTNSYTSSKSKIFPRFYESFSFGRHVEKYIRENKNNLDTVYINSWPIASQYLIIKICKKFKIETVTHIQDIYPETLINKLPLLRSFFYKLLLPIDKYILVASRTVVTISSGMKSRLIETRSLAEDKVKIVYNWQNIKKANNVERKKEGFTMMFLGSLSPSAQIESIINAFGELENEKANLVIAGSGSEKEKLQKISKGYSGAKIEFISAPSDEVANIQSQADVLVLSLREGVGKIALPSKLVSYMFSGKPVLAIVEKNCDIEQIIRESDGGWVVEQNKTDEIKNRMLELINLEANILKEKGENSLNFAINNLSREANLSKLEKIILNDE